MRALNFRNKLRCDNNLKRWMFTILRNIWLNQMRKERGSPGLTGRACADVMELAAGLPHDPHEQLIWEAETERVREAIRQLPNVLREVLLLREYEDLSYREIEELLGCPAGTVMSRLARARLRKLLEDFRMEKGTCGVSTRAGDTRLRMRELSALPLSVLLRRVRCDPVRRRWPGLS